MLYKTKQYISLKILLGGIPSKHFWNTKIKFLGKVSSLKEILIESEFEETKLSLLKILSPKEFLHVLQSPPYQTISLVKNTLPPPLSEYIPRSLLTGQVLAPNSLQICSETCKTITENELISLIYSNNLNNGICIYAASETGKTTLLGNLAQKMAERFPQTIVIYLPVVDLLRKFQKSANKLKSSLVRKLLLEYISPSTLALSLLTFLLENRFVHIHLFVDGLDHLDERKLIWSQQILHAIQKAFENISIRFYMALSDYNTEIINLLNLKQYKLKHLSKVDQVDFLQNFWRCRYDLGWTQKLELQEFATFCIQQFQKVMTAGLDQEGSVVKLRLLAELFSERAYDYSQRFHNRIRSSDSVMFPRTTLQLYTRFVEFKIHEILENQQNVSKMKQKIDISPDIEDINKYLRLLALRKIFPYYTQTIDIPTLECNIKIDILDMGLDNLSISEHLVAEYFTKVIATSTYHVQSDLQASVALNYFYNEILEPQKYGVKELKLSAHFKLYCFKYTRILLMINAHLEEYRLNNSRNDFMNLAKRILMCVDPIRFKFPSSFYFMNRLYEIIQASVFHNFSNIFLLVAEILVALKNGNYRNKYLEDRKPYEVLLTACTFGPLNVVQDCLDLFIERCDFNATNIIISRNKVQSYTSLHIAIRNLDYVLAKLVVDKIPELDLEKLGLVHECVQESHKDF